MPAVPADPVLQLRLNSAAKRPPQLVPAHPGSTRLRRPIRDATAKFRSLAIYGFSAPCWQFDRAAEVSEVAAKLTELDRRLAEAGR